jgi:putative restriction endonuclease
LNDPDVDIRVAAFERLEFLSKLHGGPLPWKSIAGGFLARDHRFLFASAAEGIFRPAGMTGLLSLKTVVPKPRRRIWYHDQGSTLPEAEGDLLWYAFSGTNPNNARNRWLREAMERRLPIVYFSGVAPGVYEPIFPTFIVEWSATKLSCGLSFSMDGEVRSAAAAPGLERRYALRTVQQRLHQAAFREQVLNAYGGRCALSGMPEGSLIDAAHIVPDGNALLGHPDVRNGICLSKIHHAAYDASLIGIDPDLRVHVSGRLFSMKDGPLLEIGLKALQGARLRPPDDPLAAPDRDRLAMHFEQFLAAA